MHTCSSKKFVCFLVAPTILLGVSFLILLGKGPTELHVAAVQHQRTLSASNRRGALDVLAGLPLRFEENRGQIDGSVRFLSRVPNGAFFLTSTEAVVVFGADSAPSIVRMSPVGGHPAPKIVGTEKLATLSNYFRGSNPDKWLTRIPNYARVEYRSIYPGIDLVYHGRNGALEYDWLVLPGADPNQISLVFSGTNGIRIDEYGELVLGTDSGEIRHRRPVAYQEASGLRRYVSAEYALLAENRVGFRLGNYDRALDLVIDPTLVFTALIGGSSTVPNPLGPPIAVNPGFAVSIALDTAKNIYVTLFTDAPDFPSPTASFGPVGTIARFIVIKLDATGTTISYITEIGGVFDDSRTGRIAIDSSGSVYVVGRTTLTSFPTTPGSFQTTLRGSSDAFITKLDPSGSLVYSTLLGGSGSEIARGIVVDPSGHSFVVGGTSSTADFPKTLGAVQNCGVTGIFVTRLNPQGTGLIYSACLDIGPGPDAGAADIAIDASGAAYIAGTSHAGLWTTPGSFQPDFIGGNCSFGSCSDAFVRKLDPSGSFLEYSTYLGGSGVDIASGIAVDSSGGASVCGHTRSEDFPIQNPIQLSFRGGDYDIFVTKLNPVGSVPVYSTYLGGSGSDACYDIAVDSAGNAYFVGYTESSDIPLTHPILAAMGGGSPRQCLFLEPCGDAFFARINSDGSSEFSSYFGGGGNDSGRGIDSDGAGNIYITGNWRSRSEAFPVMGPVQQSKGNGVFILKLSESGTTPLFTAQAATNGASFRSGIPGFSGSGIGTVFGRDITNVAGILQSSSLPLPTELSGSSVTINGIRCPLYAVANVNGQEQINFQVPSTLVNPLVMIVTNNGVQSLPIIVTNGGPGLFTTDGTRGAIQHNSDFRPVTPSDPAAKGEVVVIYATGLGRVEPEPPLGYPASSSSLSVTTTMPTVTVGGIQAEVLFSGLAPGFVALNQVNIRIPVDAPSGEVSVVLTIRFGNITLTSNAAVISVQ